MRAMYGAVLTRPRSFAECSLTVRTWYAQNGEVSARLCLAENYAERSNRDARSRSVNGTAVFTDTGAATTGRLASGYSICSNNSQEAIRSLGFLVKQDAIISSNLAGSDG